MSKPLCTGKVQGQILRKSGAVRKVKLTMPYQVDSVAEAPVAGVEAFPVPLAG